MYPIIALHFLPTRSRRSLSIPWSLSVMENTTLNPHSVVSNFTISISDLEETLHRWLLIICGVISIFLSWIMIMLIIYRTPMSSRRYRFGLIALQVSNHNCEIKLLLISDLLYNIWSPCLPPLLSNNSPSLLCWLLHWVSLWDCGVELPRAIREPSHLN